jgi:CheY-like chemotaxis protein
VRLLHIENDASARLRFARAARRYYDVEELVQVGSLEEASHRLKEGEEYDGIVTDVRLPDSGGPLAVRLLLPLRGRGCLVAYSDDPSEMKRAINEGAIHWVRTSNTLEGIRHEVDEILTQVSAYLDTRDLPRVSSAPA